MCPLLYTNTIQFVANDQLAVWNDISIRLLLHEMITVWVVWYYGGNYRGTINSLHSKYQNKKLNQNTSNIMLSELVNINQHNYIDYNGELGDISNMIKDEKLSYDDYGRIFDISRNTFSIDRSYKGNNVPMYKSSRFILDKDNGYKMYVGDIELV
ncbi:hypothetical protein [Clostridium celatum]|uniref:hypothetical protein n=1 Tax=Clostridium celatum TaxID=36834 RepID=UPI001899FFC4|nr:hypothetical protein [Clostridium celatum]